MASEAGSPRLGSTVDRDRSILALLEVGAAALLIGWFFLPWYSAGLSWGSYSPEALTTADLLIPFASLAAIVVTVVGMAMPARGAKIAILVAFVAALYGAMLDFQQVLARDAVPQPTAGPGLWLFPLTAASGVVLAGVDVARGGNCPAGPLMPIGAGATPARNAADAATRKDRELARARSLGFAGGRNQA
jgi:hypothetical protein